MNECCEKVLELEIYSPKERQGYTYRERVREIERIRSIAKEREKQNDKKKMSSVDMYTHRERWVIRESERGR